MQTVSNPNALALLRAYEILLEVGRRARQEAEERHIVANNGPDNNDNLERRSEPA
jgi:hypothetical protein